MVTLRSEVEGPAFAVEQYIDAIPVVMQRFRELPFDDDGVAHFEVGRRSGLRLLSGTHPYEGARYRIVTASTSPDDRVEPIEVAVTTNRADLTEFSVTSSRVLGTVALDDPSAPSRLRCSLDVAVPDLPPLLGSSLHVAGTAQLQDLWGLPGPQLAAHVSLKGAEGEATVEIARSAPERWRVTLVITLRPRGLFVLALAAWPFVRRRVQRGVDQAVRDLLVDLAGEGGDTRDEPQGPTEIGDWVFAGVPDSLAP